MHHPYTAPKTTLSLYMVQLYYTSTVHTESIQTPSNHYITICYVAANPHQSILN